MSNQVAAEALYSATYVKNYLDSVENLPDDVQRHLSRIRDIDVQYRTHLREVDHYYEQWRGALSVSNETSGPKRVRNHMARIQQNLIAAQELGDEKLQIVNQLQELIDQKTRQLDLDFKNLDYGKEEPLPEIPQKVPRPATPVIQAPLSTKVENQSFPLAQQNPQRGSTPTIQQTDKSSATTNPERANKRSRRPRNDANNTSANDGGVPGETNATSETTTQSKQSSNNNVNQGNNSATSNSASQKKGSNTGGGGGKKKKRKARGQANTNQSSSVRDTRDDTPPLEEAIDPDEPTYCLCDQISFGEMILCDNDLCPIEWFHFSCVSLGSKPKGKWYCPNCRGDRPNIMKPKAQFLKELERYNKEKEEKT